MHLPTLLELQPTVFSDFRVTTVETSALTAFHDILGMYFVLRAQPTVSLNMPCSSKIKVQQNFSMLGALAEFLYQYIEYAPYVYIAVQQSQFIILAKTIRNQSLLKGRLVELEKRVDTFDRKLARIQSVLEDTRQDLEEVQAVLADRKIRADSKAADIAAPFDTYFQLPASDIMSKIVDLHDDLMFFLIVIVLFVSWMLLRKITFFNTNNAATPRVAFAHHTLLEKIWTYIPAGILVLIASPSFSLLYAIDALAEPQVTVKVIGHQWYWSYETTEYRTSKDINFDSYMMPESDLPRGGARLLEVDNRLPLPVRTNLRLIITAADVLHSWAVPALGVKMDACPGRLNQVSLYIDRSGAFFGQCSELCGINHSFMPIVVDSVTAEQYQRWINAQE